MTWQDVHPEGFFEEDVYHWCAASQTYAPAHILRDFLQRAWKAEATVCLRQAPLTGYRMANIYTFTLYRQHERLEISVVENPVVLRLIYELNLQVIGLRPN